ncbi:hypothetical protein D9757_006064 [Collybiopsis confluens]|uniref:Uncharacterized protein n=1 Tax=Collybiopsis confluens TaxID=2823264 RepID=A0A8H5HUX0_9AGAR|nr:hypothetical protein D9757_006064 [Collybiopsis confluens]
MAIGRFVRAFSLLREESEKSPKNISGSSKLPYGTLSGSDTNAVKGVENARKSDIENERLPPDLYDADSEEGKALIAPGSLPSTPPAHQEGTPSTPVAENGVAAGLQLHYRVAQHLLHLRRSTHLHRSLFP